MRIWIDCEFIEDAKTIDLISIGMVREDGAQLYLENAECDLDKAGEWVRENVLPSLSLHPSIRKTRAEIRDEILQFAGTAPEFWGYYSAYDWVALCQLFGFMIDLPDDWPRYCRDIKQFADSLGNPKLPKQKTLKHHALDDALWNKEAWEFLCKIDARTGDL